MSFAVRATSGAAARHGPHQSAQKSTRMGTRELWTISSKSAVSTCIGSSSGGNGVLHAPQRPVSARLVAAMRFFWPQALQVLITGICSLLLIGFILQAAVAFASLLRSTVMCIMLRRLAECCSIGRKPPAGTGAPAILVRLIVSIQ